MKPNRLAGEDDGRFGEEHALILTELERFENRGAARLRFSRKKEFHFEAANLRDRVHDTVGDLKPALAKSGTEIMVEANDGLRSQIDGGKVRQVLVNLIESARDALRAADGRREIRVDLNRMGEEARLTVAGPGIDAEDLPHLFEPFFSRKATGTGLGRAIVQRAIKATAAALPPVRSIGLEAYPT
ncbi:MAG: HAMP domain-containing sensor histidine kinase [Candidatus Binatia bacterium]|nr:HAMP domain-containing sensor histidine kinase [Candidatus Binatia bacterium]